MTVQNLYQFLINNKQRSYEAKWLVEKTQMSAAELNEAAKILESQSLVRLYKDIGGNYPYNFSNIEVLNFGDE